MWQIDPERLAAVFLYDKQNPLIFSSGLFIFLFLAFLVVYSLLRKRDTARILFVTLFSYYFYYKSSGFYFFLLGVVSASDFLIARRIYNTESKRMRISMLCLSLGINLGLLAYFKYTNFFMEIFSGSDGFVPLDIFLPVGISFFTFQSLSYTIDVYRRRIRPLDRFLDYAFYVSFFPQLVAGPIVRARDFIPQIRRKLFVSREMFGEGCFFIFSGLFKKAVISDYISINFVERIFENPALYSGVENLLGVYGYALQIYCDFSGYSDMAIGIALLLGFRFPINFDSPYQSASVTEFWRRWHISLSSWLKDYLYIGLGGNRKGKWRTYANLMITMLLGGLWHGASWNFVVWGGLHGIALAFHKGWRSMRGVDKTYKSSGWKKTGAVILTFHFVCLGWIFFRNNDFHSSIAMIRSIFTNFSPEVFPGLISAYYSVFVLMLAGFVLHFLPRFFETGFKNFMIQLPLALKIVVFAILVYAIMQIKSSDIQPFIYFRF